MDDPAYLLHRLHFGFTVTFHYLFPQLTMGLAPLIVVLRTMALRRNDALPGEAARFWAKIFGLNFVMGVVSGVPMEFQFGTNWNSIGTPLTTPITKLSPKIFAQKRAASPGSASLRRSAMVRSTTISGASPMVSWGNK